ncbi:hypothetical protein LCGC14_0534980 [marine sediment metagenome]|uniref:Uncharacterized protein n=1 Tax=marine sediment metagenome TaxID=412755 RepID=A0A0F9RUH9_9ZZZZ
MSKDLHELVIYCPEEQPNSEYGKHRHNFGWNTLKDDYVCRHCGFSLLKEAEENAVDVVPTTELANEGKYLDIFKAIPIGKEKT